MTGRLAAVFFDMDGTLVDSEPVWDEAMRELARWFGERHAEVGRLPD